MTEKERLLDLLIFFKEKLYYSAAIGMIMKSYLRLRLPEEDAQFLIDWANENLPE